MSEYGLPPFRAEYGCHAAEPLGVENDLFWHVDDRKMEPVAFFFCEEDAVQVAALWNGLADSRKEEPHPALATNLAGVCGVEFKPGWVCLKDRGHDAPHGDAESQVDDNG